MPLCDSCGQPIHSVTAEAADREAAGDAARAIRGLDSAAADLDANPWAADPYGQAAEAADREAAAGSVEGPGARASRLPSAAAEPGEWEKHHPSEANLASADPPMRSVHEYEQRYNLPCLLRDTPEDRERLRRALADGRRTQWACTVDHRNQYGEPMPCPDGDWKEADAIIAALRERS